VPAAVGLTTPFFAVAVTAALHKCLRTATTATSLPVAEEPALDVGHDVSQARVVVNDTFPSELTGTVTRFAAVCPATKLRFEASGRSRPAG
jgi:hypothetical protein